MNSQGAIPSNYIQVNEGGNLDGDGIDKRIKI